MTCCRLVRLENGMPLCVAEMPWMESVSIGVWAGIGGRHDPAALPGLAHFVEHMVFKGTTRRSARRLNSVVESVGGSMDAYTSEDHTSFFVRGPAEQFDRFADVLLDVYRHSIFDREDVRREREVIAEEIAMYREQPQQLIEDVLCRTVWPDHPLGRPIAGTVESVARIDVPALKRHAALWFGRRNTVVSVAGRIQAGDAARVFNRLLRTGPGDGRRPRLKRFVPPRRRRPVTGFEQRDVEQVQLALAFHAPDRHSPDLPALRLLNVLLGENTSSRLWNELRERRGLCYDAGSDITTLEDTGILHLFAGVDPDRLATALKVILRELRRLVERPVSRQALRAACEYAIGTSRMALESAVSQMTSLAESVLFYRRIIPVDESRDRLRAVTPAEVQALAARLFQPGRLAAAVVGPDKAAATMLTEMASGSW